jgi:uncharacterized protein (TIRG00374 family)
MDMKTKKTLFWAILFSAMFMVFLLWQVEWKHFPMIAGRLDLKGLFASLTLFIAGNFVRALRFHKLDHTGNKLAHWWNTNAFYNIATATLPGGSGEAASAYLLRRFSSFNLLSALRILLLSRLLDLFSLSTLFLIAAVLIGSETPYRETAIIISGALFIVSILALLRLSEQFIIKLIQKIPGHSSLKDKMYSRLTELLKISEEQRRNNTFGATLLQSVVMMILGILSVHLLLRSFGIDFTPLQSTYCYGIYMIFQIVPVQGVAGIGTQAAWWVLALRASGYRAPEVVAMGFILHGAFYVFIAVIGLSALLVWLTRS